MRLTHFPSVVRRGLKDAVFLLIGLCIPILSHASTVLVTFTGTVYANGTDQSNTGSGVFGPPGSLSGKAFKLVYTFNDTKGQQTFLKNGNGITYWSEITGSGENSPAIATLTIGNTTVTIGDGSVEPGATTAYTDAWRDVLDSTRSQVVFKIQDNNTRTTPNSLSHSAAQVSVNVPTTNPDWRAAVSAAIPVPNYFGEFYYNKYNQVASPSTYAVASGALQIENVTISGALTSDVATLVDPVPLNPGDVSILTGPAITKDPTMLAKQAVSGREVQGVATDGVAQLVIRVPATTVGEQFTLSIDPTQCPTRTVDDCGIVFDPTASPPNLLNGPSPYPFVVTAVSTTKGPMAFAAYRAPIDFVRTGTLTTSATTVAAMASNNSDDTQTGSRSVTINILSQTYGTLASKSITLVRPPVFLIHGNWSDSSGWNSFRPISDGSDKYHRFTESNTFRIDYSRTMGLGIRGSIPTVRSQFVSFNALFRQNSSVAAVQADVIGYSLGGLIARAVSQDTHTTSLFAFRRGAIHKLITLDTPHNGSPFATALVHGSLACKLSIGIVKTIGQNITDLMPESAVLQDLKTYKNYAWHVPTHAVVGTASPDQSGAAAVSLRKLLVCASLLPNTGTFVDLFGSVPNDLIVSQSSQSGTNLGIAGGTIPYSSASVSVVHTVVPNVIPVGPDVLGNDAAIGPENVITNHVIDLLNTPVNTSSMFSPILP